MVGGGGGGVVSARTGGGGRKLSYLASRCRKGTALNASSREHVDCDGKKKKEKIGNLDRRKKKKKGWRMRKLGLMGV